MVAYNMAHIMRLAPRTRSNMTDDDGVLRTEIMALRWVGLA